MDSPQQPRDERERHSGRLVVITLILVAGGIGLGMLGWMLSLSPDDVDYEESGPTQTDRVFPPPIEDE